MTNSGELTNCRCGVNAESLCERGYSQPPGVLPLPVWDNASMQIIHDDEFMSSITRHIVPVLKSYKKDCDRIYTMAKVSAEYLAVYYR